MSERFTVSRERPHSTGVESTSHRSSFQLGQSRASAPPEVGDQVGPWIPLKSGAAAGSSSLSDRRAHQLECRICATRWSASSPADVANDCRARRGRACAEPAVGQGGCPVRPSRAGSGAVALGNPSTQHAVVYAASGAIGQVDGIAAPLIGRSPTVPGSVTVAGIMQCAAWAEAE